MLRRFTVLAAGVLAAGVTVVNALPAHAFSDSDTVTLPGTSIKLQTNAWSQSFAGNSRFDWKTSSKASKSGSAFKVATIKNTATMQATGVAVSVSGSGLSGSTGITSKYSLSWTNNKASISDLSGRSQTKGILLKFSVNSLAFATHAGVKKSVDVWSW